MKRLLLLLILFTFFYPALLLSQKNVTPKGVPEVSGIPMEKLNNTDEVYSPDNLIYNVHIMNGTSANCRAPQGSQRYIRTCYIISASELSAAGFPSGDINLLGFNYSAAQSIATTGSFKVYLENTSDVQYNKASLLWSDVISTMTLAHDNPVTIPAAIGNFDIPFVGGSAFNYTGGGLYIAFEYQNPSGSLSTANIANCNTAIAPGLRNAFSTTSLPASLGALSAFRPCTRLGNSLVDIVEIKQIYTLGKIPVPFGNPDIISALVINNGPNLLNCNVNLFVRNASTNELRYSDAQIINDLAPGASITLNFQGYSPTILETDSITVQIDPQQGEMYIINNKKAVVQQVNSNSFSYSQGTVASGGVGFGGTTGDFVAKFTTNSSNSINQVDVNFNTAGQPFKVGIWDNTGVGGTPGTNIYLSESFTSAIGVSTVIVDPPIAVNGSFYVGVQQTGTTNVSFSYQNESPIRSSTFYYTSPTGGTTWTDFSPTNSFRFMIEPKFALNNDVGVSSIAQSGSNYFPLGTTSTPMTGVVANYGLNPASFNITRVVKDSSNIQIYSNTQVVSSLASNSTSNVTFAPFTFSSGVTYRIKDSTSLSGDQNTLNDTLTKYFTPIIINTTCILYTDIPSRDSVAAQMTRAGFTQYDQINGANFTSSLSAWKTVFYVLASGGNWTASIRDSLKNFLDNSTPEDKKSLYIFGNELGYYNDPLRNVSAPAADTVFFRQYLRGQYIADNWITEFTASASKFKGLDLFSSVNGDSCIDAFPDLVKPVNGGLAAFIPITESGDGDSCLAVYYTGNYNMFYGTNTYSTFRTSASKSPFSIFQALLEWGITNAGVFPVEIVSFTSVINKDGVLLNWSTSNEINNSGFAIERSLDKITWDKLGFVQGAGNSNATKYYSFCDNTVSLKGKYYYRLKQIDFDGLVKYSDVVETEVNGVTKYELSQNYPNPFNPNTIIKYQVPLTGLVTLKVFDVLGNEVTILVNELKQGGTYSVTFNGSGLSSGVYFYRLQAGDFTSVKKLTLIK